MRPRELVKRIERGEKWRPDSRDIEQLSPKNCGKIKRGFIRRVVCDNWLEILTGVFIVVGIWVIVLMFISKLPDPVM